MSTLPPDNGRKQAEGRLVGREKIYGKRRGYYTEPGPYDAPEPYDGLVVEAVRNPSDGERGPLPATFLARFHRIVADVVRECKAQGKNPVDLELAEIAKMSRLKPRTLESLFLSKDFRQIHIICEAWRLMGCPQFELGPKENPLH